jgi:hypothetical protein
MADLKTSPSSKPVEEFIRSINNKQQQEDSRVLLDLMGKVTSEKPVIWGESIVGFGSYHYVYKSGREGDWFLTGFSPRKQNMTVYIMEGLSAYDTELRNLGKCKNSVSCLYFKRLSDIDIDILESILRDSVEKLRTKYG